MSPVKAVLLAGIASIAGMTFLDRNRCQPSEPIHILHIHGTADTVISYPGIVLSGPHNYPGALETVQIWADYNGAHDLITDANPSLDLNSTVPGPETVISRYAQGVPGGAVELWTILGADHGQFLSDPEFSPRVVNWLLAHPKP